VTGGTKYCNIFPASSWPRSPACIIVSLRAFLYRFPMRCDMRLPMVSVFDSLDHIRRPIQKEAVASFVETYSHQTFHRTLRKALRTWYTYLQSYISTRTVPFAVHRFKFTPKTKARMNHHTLQRQYISPATHNKKRSTLFRSSCTVPVPFVDLIFVLYSCQDDASRRSRGPC
jgi:hypothetical protein